MLGNSSQHPAFGHFTLECALNSSFHWFIRESWAWERPGYRPCSHPGLCCPAPDSALSPGLWEPRTGPAGPQAVSRSPHARNSQWIWAEGSALDTQQASLPRQWAPQQTL